MGRRWIALAMVVVAMALLGTGVFSGLWISGSMGVTEINAGLRSLTICVGESCMASSLKEAGDGGAATWLGLVCIGVGLGAVVALGLSAAASVRGFARAWPVAPSTLAIVLCGVALVSGVLELILLKQLVGSRAAGTGVSFLLFGSGAALGLTGAILVGQASSCDEDQFEPPFETV